MSRFVLVALLALTFATGGPVVAHASAAPRSGARTVSTTQTTPLERILNEVAVKDLRALPSAMGFAPLLPAHLALPAGDLYNRMHLGRSCRRLRGIHQLATWDGWEPRYPHGSVAGVCG